MCARSSEVCAVCLRVARGRDGGVVDPAGAASRAMTKRESVERLKNRRVRVRPFCCDCCQYHYQWRIHVRSIESVEYRPYIERAVDQSTGGDVRGRVRARASCGTSGEQHAKGRRRRDGGFVRVEVTPHQTAAARELYRAASTYPREAGRGGAWAVGQVFANRDTGLRECANRLGVVARGLLYRVSSASDQ